MKIVQVRITNFRGIAEGTVHFDGHTVLVGDNNAGKSTLLEAISRNPSFLPQLAVISKIVIVSLPTAASTSVNALDEYARAIAVEQENALLVFLEPGLSKARHA